MPDELVTEEQIGALVDQFYARVRVDAEIGPIFNAAIQDWPAHLALLKDFWSSVLLTTGRYKGNPMMTHLQLPLQPKHFRRWLALFSDTARETMTPAQAEAIIARAERIAENFLAAMSDQSRALCSTVRSRWSAVLTSLEAKRGQVSGTRVSGICGMNAGTEVPTYLPSYPNRRRSE